MGTHNGKEIIRQTRTEIVVDEKGVKSQPLSGDDRVKSYEAASRDKSIASLTVREKSYGPRIPISPSEWEFASCVKDSRSGKETVKLSGKHLYLHGGFKPGHIYEFIYAAKNPSVLGLGFAAVRDLVSSCVPNEGSAGRPNPLVTDRKPLNPCAYGWSAHRAAGFFATSLSRL